MVAAEKKLEAFRAREGEWHGGAPWSEFLIELQRAYSKLAAGATGPSAAWFGTVTRERRTDPLLAYVHNARHADEHGLEPVAAPAAKGRLLEPHEPRPIISFTIVADDGSEQVLGPDGDMILLDAPETQLRPVKNRGVIYPVPTSHRDVPLPNPTANEVGRLALAHLKETVAEAERRYRR